MQRRTHLIFSEMKHRRRRYVVVDGARQWARRGQCFIFWTIVVYVPFLVYYSTTADLMNYRDYDATGTEFQSLEVANSLTWRKHTAYDRITKAVRNQSGHDGGKSTFHYRDEGCLCDATALEQNKLIILSKPWRYFSSAHWFHICEYYLPHHAEVSHFMVPNATVFLVAPSHRFVAQLTRMSMFLLVVALTDGHAERVEVVPPDAIHLGGEAIAHIQSDLYNTFVYDSRLPLRNRFQRAPSKKRTLRLRPCACARVIGEVGGAPVERGHWFGSISDSTESRDARVRETRRRVRALCSDVPALSLAPLRQVDPPSFSVEGAEKWAVKLRTNLGLLFSQHKMGLTTPRVISGDAWHSKPAGQPNKMVLYQRNRDRVVRKHELALHLLNARLGERWNITLALHDDDRHPCTVWRMLRDVDVLLTPHGFQSILLLFMPHGSVIFEIFPYKYWKDGYRPFANEYGLFHGWSQNRRATNWARNVALSFVSQESCMQWSSCREFARRDDVTIDAGTVKIIASLAAAATGHSGAGGQSTGNLGP